MKGLVMKSTGSFYEVRLHDGAVLTCRVRGKMRLDGIKETNPIAVGDYVEVETGSDYSSIVNVHPRVNHMLRQSVKKTGHAHVLAANIDQVVLLATIKQPRTSFGFIDRFFISAESFRIPQVLVYNKSDLLTPDEHHMLAEVQQGYAKIGVRTFTISVKRNEGLNELVKVFDGRVTLLAGHSGVGKSTFLNAIMPHLQLPVGDISDFSAKGTHTTTFAEMFSLDDRSFVIDTPGVKEWGLVNMEPDEISDYFPEMRELRSDCKFGYRCLHINEPGCAVKEAVGEGAIMATRYDSYASMIAGEDNRK